MSSKNIDIINRALHGKQGLKHECEALKNTIVDISIETIKGRWYLIFWKESCTEAHGIAYCPYCGKKLEER